MYFSQGILTGLKSAHGDNSSAPGIILTVGEAHLNEVLLLTTRHTRIGALGTASLLFTQENYFEFLYLEYSKPDYWNEH